MSYFAELDKSALVVRVVVADSAEWCAEHLGGTWVETADPYDPKDNRTYCGPGYGFDEKHPQRFAPEWTRKVIDDPQADVKDLSVTVWHDGTIITLAGDALKSDPVAVVADGKVIP